VDIVVTNVFEVELESLVSSKKRFTTCFNRTYNYSKYIKGAR